ncbi:MAG: hypothetical protein MZV63_11490 [Marinilabiliales bacterium]|nr:hypothetical protein [Marinilabiliales bacterium]
MDSQQLPDDPSDGMGQGVTTTAFAGRVRLHRFPGRNTTGCSAMWMYTGYGLAWPRLGLDEKNQWDLYSEPPGRDLDGLRRISRQA